MIAEGASEYLEQYGDTLPIDEKMSLSLLTRASGQRSPEAFEALTADISQSDAAKTAAFHRDLFAVNPNLSIYLLQPRLQAQQIVDGQFQRGVHEALRLQRSGKPAGARPAFVAAAI